MSLTPAQDAVLKTHMLANQDAGLQAAISSGNDTFVAAFYNAQASPGYYAWRTSISVDEIRSVVDWGEVVALNTNTLLAFQVLTDAETINPSAASIRDAFGDIFSGPGGVNSRTALTAAAKRTCTLAESVLASGAGTEANPSTLGWEGTLSTGDIARILRG